MNAKPIPPEVKSDLFMARLYRYVRFNGACWEFDGRLDEDGYGKIKLNRQVWLVHRLSYYIHKGDPGNLLVCHQCDNPCCFNPLHLFLGTVKDNTVEASVKGRLATGDKNGLRQFKLKVKQGLAKGPVINTVGEQNPAAKFTEADVLTIRRLCGNRTMSRKEMADKYGVTIGAVHHIMQRRTWSHIPPEKIN